MKNNLLDKVYKKVKFEWGMSEDEMKTLKDIKGNLLNRYFSIERRKLKQEAIKWIKEDIIFLKGLSNEPAMIIIDNWMKRLNISEEELEK